MILIGETANCLLFHSLHRCVLKIANFRYHGNRGLSESNLSSIGRPRKPYNRAKNEKPISYTSGVKANFLLKFQNFRYHGNRGWCDKNFVCTVKFADPETLCFVQELGT